jgi:hypothetical protein
VPAKVFSDFDEHKPPPEELPLQRDQEEQPAPTSDDRGGMQDMQTLFTASEQKTFIRKIFRRHEIEFRLALDELNKITSWEEAARYLREIFLLNDVDPFSEEAILFTDKIQSRYLTVGGEEQSG